MQFVNLFDVNFEEFRVSVQCLKSKIISYKKERFSNENRFFFIILNTL